MLNSSMRLGAEDALVSVVHGGEDRKDSSLVMALCLGDHFEQQLHVLLTSPKPSQCGGLLARRLGRKEPDLETLACRRWSCIISVHLVPAYAMSVLHITWRTHRTLGGCYLGRDQWLLCIPH